MYYGPMAEKFDKMMKDLRRLPKLIMEAKTPRDWEKVAALRNEVMPKLREHLDSLTPDERARVFAGYTPEKWLSDLLGDIERARAAGDGVAVAEHEAPRRPGVGSPTYGE